MERRANAAEPNAKPHAPEDTHAPVKTAYFYRSATGGRYQQAVRLTISPLRHRQLESLLVSIESNVYLLLLNA